MPTPLASTPPPANPPIDTSDTLSPTGSGKLSEVSETVPLPPSSRTPDSSKPERGILSSADLLRELEACAQEENELWGAFVPKGALVLVVGEASAGKSVFMYRLARSLADGKEFLGLTPPKPLRVLHVDLESPDPVKEDLLSTVGPAPNWDFGKLDPAQVLGTLLTAGRGYDLIIVDSLQVASPVKDENDNAEANRQITPYVHVARTTGASVVLIHNAGQGHPNEKFKARGATARVDRADVVINLDEIGEGKRRLKVVKSRYGNVGDTLEFEFAEGLNYALTKPAQRPTSKRQEMERRILDAMPAFGPPGIELERRRVSDQLGIRAGSAEERQFERALEGLVGREMLLRPRHGVYALPPRDCSPSDNPDSVPNPLESVVSEAPPLGETLCVTQTNPVEVGVN